MQPHISTKAQHVDNTHKLGEWRVVIAPNGEATVETQAGVPIATIHGDSRDQLLHALLIARAPHLRDVIRACQEVFQLISENEQGPAQLAALDLLPTLAEALAPIEATSIQPMSPSQRRATPAEGHKLHDAIFEVPAIVRQLLEAVHTLEELFPGRRFTIDGHLMGSLGEVYARHVYGLTLLPSSRKDHDAETQSGRLVQIKATQRPRVSLYSQPQHLLVLQLTREGNWNEVYNGPGALMWQFVSPVAKNGQCTVPLSKLRTLMEHVPRGDRLPTVRAA